MSNLNRCLIWLKIFLFIGNALAIEEVQSWGAISVKANSDSSNGEIPLIPGQDDGMKSQLPFKGFPDYGDNKVQENLGGLEVRVPLVDPFKENRKEIAKELEQPSQRDETLKIIGKMLSLSNIPAFPRPSNYGNEQSRFPAFQVPPPLRFLAPSKGFAKGHGAFETQKDPFSTSVNQLLSAIYEHPGRMTLENESSPTQKLRKISDPFDPLTVFRRHVKEGKRSSNSGYICHFKLCQFGSSGKRLYKPQQPRHLDSSMGT